MGVFVILCVVCACCKHTRVSDGDLRTYVLTCHHQILHYGPCINTCVGSSFVENNNNLQTLLFDVGAVVGVVHDIWQLVVIVICVSVDMYIA